MHDKDRTIFEFPVFEFAFNDGITIIKKLKPGKTVTLKAEADNPYNPDAVAIYYKDAKIGYIPEGDGYLFQLLYFGHNDIIEAKISHKNLKCNEGCKLRVAVKVKDNRVRLD